MYPVEKQACFKLACFTACFLLASIIACPPVFARNIDTTWYHTDTARPAHTALTDNADAITTFEDFNIPPEMLVRFEQITPDEIARFHEELQVTKSDEEGNTVILIVKLWFVRDHLVGYIMQAPLDKTTQVTVSKHRINIPVEWVCTPPTRKHQQHFVSSLGDIKTAEEQYKCSGWHIKMHDTITEAYTKRSRGHSI
jgi:hypothetical protein